ncbi:MAG TPA: two-component system sensor histidine kinase BaeS [Arsenophonus apicola]|uniref:envelope stress sensor histidine kinase BaeS n=1 Tax=Arsenophonus apicola TaxID=2879119 RepID=UPI0038799408
MKIHFSGVTSKLFFAIFALCLLIVFTMHWGIRLTFEQGFIGYIKQTNELRTSLIAQALTEQYQQTGNWSFLQHNGRAVTRIINTLEQENFLPTQSSAKSWRTQVWIVDHNMDRLSGRGKLPIVSEDIIQKPVKYHNQIVGWVMSNAADKISREADINFDRQQHITSSLVTMFSLLLALITTFLLARNFLKPIKHILEGTHQLTTGNFAVRVQISSRDELGQLAKDFNQLASTLEKNEHMRRDYMADISHELRTPLAILRGELEAIQDGVRPLSVTTLHSLLTETNTLIKLVNDLHQLSLSDRGSLVYRKKNINLVQQIELAISSYRSRFADKQITLNITLPSKITLNADPDRLAQLWHNLLENSLRYTHSPGSLVIQGYVAEHSFYLIWQDSAPGLLDDQYPYIFERFYRVENSRNRASGGSGLGLAICYNIIEAHGGKIIASASSLGGVKISLELPLDDNHKSQSV